MLPLPYEIAWILTAILRANPCVEPYLLISLIAYNKHKHTYWTDWSSLPVPQKLVGRLTLSFAILHNFEFNGPQTGLLDFRENNALSFLLSV